MGDNFFLGDRNGVRTPMQWSPDRNAGFSHADPQRLYLPPIMDPIYGYEAVNVEAQVRERASLLNWMQRVLAVRKNHQAFGRGELVFLHPWQSQNTRLFQNIPGRHHPLRVQPVARCATGRTRSVCLQGIRAGGIDGACSFSAGW